MNEIISDNLEFIIPQFLLSLYGIYLIISGFIWIQGNTISGKKSISILPELRNGHLKTVYETLKGNTVEKKVFTHAVTHIQKGKRGDLKSELMHLVSSSFHGQRSNLSALFTLANISTLIGLFGTVIGMIIAFTDMRDAGESNPFILAGGISKALITTAIGLLIAITFLLSRYVLKRIILKKEQFYIDLIEHFHHKASER